MQIIQFKGKDLIGRTGCTMYVLKIYEEILINYLHINSSPGWPQVSVFSIPALGQWSTSGGKLESNQLEPSAPRIHRLTWTLPTAQKPESLCLSVSFPAHFRDPLNFLHSNFSLTLPSWKMTFTPTSPRKYKLSDTYVYISSCFSH